LAEYAGQQMAAYKRPSQIVIMPAMPITPTGKIVKAELKKVAESSGFGAHLVTKLTPGAESV